VPVSETLSHLLVKPYQHFCVGPSFFLAAQEWMVYCKHTFMLCAPLSCGDRRTFRPLSRILQIWPKQPNKKQARRYNQKHFILYAFVYFAFLQAVFLACKRYSSNANTDADAGNVKHCVSCSRRINRKSINCFVRIPVFRRVNRMKCG